MEAQTLCGNPESRLAKASSGWRRNRVDPDGGRVQRLGKPDHDDHAAAATGARVSERIVLQHALAQRLMGISLIGSPVLRLECSDPSILRTEHPPCHLISARARPLPEHDLARSALLAMQAQLIWSTHRGLRRARWSHTSLRFDNAPLQSDGDTPESRARWKRRFNGWCANPQRLEFCLMIIASSARERQQVGGAV